jgi:Ni/Fe-hydrogenase subunit HybB-like protein
MRLLINKPICSLICILVIVITLVIGKWFIHYFDSSEKFNPIIIWISALLISAVSLIVGKIRSENPRVWEVAFIVWALSVMKSFMS